MRVLLIEDVPATAEILQHVLSSFPPVESVTWRSTVPKKVNDRYDLVVMDLRMGGYSGCGALRALREYAPAVSVIVYADLPNAQELAEALQLGAAVVAKETLMSDLGPAIQTAFGGTPPEGSETLDRLRARAAEAVRQRFDASESGVRMVRKKARERITEVQRRLA